MIKYMHVLSKKKTIKKISYVISYSIAPHIAFAYNIQFTGNFFNLFISIIIFYIYIFFSFTPHTAGQAEILEALRVEWQHSTPR